MCGRYALSLRPSQVRQRLADQNMPAEEAPDDDDDRVRPSYNFAPGYQGLIYRAQGYQTGGPSPKRTKLSHPPSTQSIQHPTPAADNHPTTYILQSAKWGLIPSWTKRPPDYASQLRTINCRDDSLARETGGMWKSMKLRKRCVVVAEGFYEWLKKNGGKEKVPHFVRRADGGLMCFAGLWDCVRGKRGEGRGEGLYTYTIVTTDPNKQLQFLHDRMPVILEPGSAEMKLWLDPTKVEWDRSLQRMLKPFEGELEVYPVDKAVGKVGNNSKGFVVPVDSKENKKNIANFFGKQREKGVKGEGEHDGEHEGGEKVGGEAGEGDGDEKRVTSKVEDPETNAPLPKPEGQADGELERAMKRDPDEEVGAEDSPVAKKMKKEMSASPVKSSPTKSTPNTAKTRSATSNAAKAKKKETPTKEGNARITAFFGGK
ncbi:hypothetical protein BAUCODRAFT_78256 [Baudoinia panamericana UAMH 10762]|uniref:DUF159 domain protein n=1 Tax=Baudoinia panamericana (strain UAMH 10762) TaxID=717646 RepID=M2N162_BAUPA|nr:uncharacterized protein BAUCODRAFT_78256 [Baudoinia panamericana UAMH 10762]EMC92375.1 hypothetical protein BAUCODRAFT_78256 [Baudoinia panamericana UAMH 10762]